MLSLSVFAFGFKLALNTHACDLPCLLFTARLDLVNVPIGPRLWLASAVGHRPRSLRARLSLLRLCERDRALPRALPHQRQARGTGHGALRQKIKKLISPSLKPVLGLLDCLKAVDVPSSFFFLRMHPALPFRHPDFCPIFS